MSEPKFFIIFSAKNYDETRRWAVFISRDDHDMEWSRDQELRNELFARHYPVNVGKTSVAIGSAPHAKRQEFCRNILDIMRGRFGADCIKRDNSAFFTKETSEEDDENAKVIQHPALMHPLEKFVMKRDEKSREYASYVIDSEVIATDAVRLANGISGNAGILIATIRGPVKVEEGWEVRFYPVQTTYKTEVFKFQVAAIIHEATPASDATKRTRIEPGELPPMLPLTDADRARDYDKLEASFHKTFEELSAYRVATSKLADFVVPDAEVAVMGPDIIDLATDRLKKAFDGKEMLTAMKSAVSGALLELQEHPTMKRLIRDPRDAAFAAEMVTDFHRALEVVKAAGVKVMPLTEIPFDLNAPVETSGESPTTERVQGSFTVFGSIQVPFGGDFSFQNGGRRIYIRARDHLVEVELEEHVNDQTPHTYLSLSAAPRLELNPELPVAIAATSFELGTKLLQYAKSMPLASWAVSAIQAHGGQVEDMDWYVND